MKDNPKLNKLHSSFACILCGIIKSDGEISSKEREKFDDFFVKEFELDKETIDTLYVASMQEDNAIEDHIELLKKGFEGQMMPKARFMQYLNDCVINDGVDDKEYEVFEMVRGRLF